jgi:predicted RNA-binding Zn-ribbon protein involved in translation (DUF1610 family)
VAGSFFVEVNYNSRAIHVMAEKKAKTAEKNAGLQQKHICPSCGAESKVTKFAGFGRKGFYLVCEKACGFVGRTR